MVLLNPLQKNYQFTFLALNILGEANILIQKYMYFIIDVHAENFQITFLNPSAKLAIVRLDKV